MTCRRAGNRDEAGRLLRQEGLALLVDPAGEAIQTFHPMAVVDAILAKRNLGTRRSMAPITVALGPGFTAGQDVDAVIETQRGHNLGPGAVAGMRCAQYRGPRHHCGVWQGAGHPQPGGRCAAKPAQDYRYSAQGGAIALVETENGHVPV